jgi:hypothetical protein
MVLVYRYGKYGWGKMKIREVKDDHAYLVVEVLVAQFKV